MKSRENELLSVFLAIDLIILNASMAVTFWFYPNLWSENTHLASIYFLHGNLSWIITYFSYTKKNLYLRDTFLNRAWRVSKRQVIFYFVAASIAVILIHNNFHRSYFLYYSLLFYIGKLGFYLFLYSYLKFKRAKNINTVHAAIIGCNDTGRVLRRIIENNPLMGYRFSGYICDEASPENNLIGSPRNLEKLIDEHDLHLIFYTISFLKNNREEITVKEVLDICNKKGIRLRFVPTDQRWFKSRINMESIGNFVVINPQEIPLDNAASRIQKRLFDMAFALFILFFVFSWLLPVIALLIKLDSKGPVFFKQARTGINNKTFNCIKFRSMTVNNKANEQQASKGDARITRIGAFLRRTNIDELPQFFNVLQGKMSIVGPRPHMLKHTEQYSALINHYLIRHYVKPGITGWAQVNGYRGETRELSSMEYRVKYDTEYIENWSFWWDLKIIWYTLFGKKSWENAG